MLGQTEKAKANYQALLRLDPDHLWATNNMASPRFASDQDHAEYSAKAADLRPLDLFRNLEAALALSTYGASPSRARRFVDRSLRLRDGRQGVLRAELMISEEDLTGAVAVLQPATVAMKYTDTLWYFWAMGSLARAWEFQGHPGHALRILEEATEQRHLTHAYLKTGWVQLELRRAELYRRLGRNADAAAVEARLDRMLAHADPDARQLLAATWPPVKRGE